MSKKARKALEKQQMAAAAAEAARIREQLIRDMQEEIRTEKQKEEEEVKNEKAELEERMAQLRKTYEVLGNNDRMYLECVADDEEKENWIMYLTCDGLPDAAKVSDMNTFMFLWTLHDKSSSIDELAKRCEIVIYLLSKLDEIVNYSWLRPASYVQECREIRQEFRDKLQESIDMASFDLLRYIEENMNRDDLKTATYVKTMKYLTFCMWTLIRFPISNKEIPEKDKKPIVVSFEEIGIKLTMPMDVDCYCMAIRGMWLRYDHYSDNGVTYSMPPLPKEYQINFDPMEYSVQEFEMKQKIRAEQVDERRLRLEEKRKMLRKMENEPPIEIHRKKPRGRQQKEPPTEPEPLPYLPTPREVVMFREEDRRKAIRKLLFWRCEKTEVNLRKYRIVGGVFHIDLVYQPPQPKDMRRNIFLTTLKLPKELKYVPFERKFIPPAPIAPNTERTPEVIEAEMNAMEAALEVLILVTVKLPKSVMWFEPPLVAQWIPEKKIWSTKDIHDIKYNEERQEITYRTGRFGVHGLAANKFINLPFQSWELKPQMGRNSRGGVVFNITAATVQAEFIIVETLVCLNSLVGGTSTIIKEILGKYMEIHFLIEAMRNAGFDLFPERDAASYMKGMPVKHPTAERHLQKCMGLLCAAYSFTWSRWNVSRNPNEIALQFRELHGCVAKERSQAILLVTPARTTIVNCTEVSPEFSYESSDPKFYADLYQLAVNNAGIKTRLLIKGTSFKLAVTVAMMLEFTNVISMSS